MKHEKIRKNWSSYKTKNFNIPSKLIKDLDENYIENCLETYKIVMKKIKDTK